MSVQSNTVKSKTNYDSIEMKFATGTAVAGAVTLDSRNGVITTESLTTAAAGEYTLTLTNEFITANSVILCSAGLGTSAAGTPGIGGVTPGTGSAVITVTNLHVSAAFDGTLKINFAIVG